MDVSWLLKVEMRSGRDAAKVFPAGQLVGDHQCYRNMLRTSSLSTRSFAVEKNVRYSLI